MENSKTKISKHQAKVRNLFEEVKGKYNDTYSKFVASYGWLRRLKSLPVFLI